MDREAKKIDKDSQDGLRSPKNAKKVRKVTQHGPKTKNSSRLDGIRETLSLLRKELKPSVTYENPFK